MANDEFVFDYRKAKRVWEERPRKVRNVGRTMAVAYFAIRRALEEGGQFVHFAGVEAHRRTFMRYLQLLCKSDAALLFQFSPKGGAYAWALKGDDIFRIIKLDGTGVHAEIEVKHGQSSRFFEDVQMCEVNRIQILEDLGEFSDIAFCGNKSAIALITGEPAPNSRIW